MSGRIRRRLYRMTHRVYTETPAFIDGEETWTARPQPKDQMLKLTQKLASYTAGRLVRFVQQSARRASTAKHLLSKLAPGSVFRRPLEENQKFNIVAFVAATTELENRGKAQS